MLKIIFTKLKFFGKKIIGSKNIKNNDFNIVIKETKLKAIGS
jgi:hypothetical protein